MSLPPPELHQGKSDETELYKLVNWLRRRLISLSVASPTMGQLMAMMDDAGGGGSGEMGPPGLQGPPGLPGGLGIPGQDGSDGEAIIIPGPIGLTGQTGATGPAGTNGVPGQDGEDGDTIIVPGPQGIAGVAGATGQAGTNGVPGQDGFDGQEWMIPGPVGPTGSTGATGPQGIQGFPGQDGADAEEFRIPGPQGFVGPKGDPGLPGFYEELPSEQPAQLRPDLQFVSGDGTVAIYNPQGPRVDISCLHGKSIFKWSTNNTGFSGFGIQENTKVVVLPADTGAVLTNAGVLTGAGGGTVATVIDNYVASLGFQPDVTPWYPIPTAHTWGGKFSWVSTYYSASGSGTATLECSVWMTTGFGALGGVYTQLCATTATLSAGVAVTSVISGGSFATTVPANSMLFMAIRRTDSNASLTLSQLTLAAVLEMFL